MAFERRPRFTRRRLLAAGLILSAGGTAVTALTRRGARLPHGFLWSLSDGDRRAMRRVFYCLDGVTLSSSAVVRWLAAREAVVGRPVAFPTRRSARRLARQLLCSTDFFQTGMDPERPARFLTLWDPLESPCYNPFRD